MAIRSISPSEVQALIAAGGPVDLIDVRTGLEWSGGHAAGARHVPLSRLDPAAVVAGRVGAAQDPIYVICASGGRSMSACEAFHAAGFTQAVNVSGGTGAWMRAGLPTERSPGGGGLGMVKQAAIILGVLAVVLFLSPCSPLSLWNPAACPVKGAATPTPAAAFDFQRDVVAASAGKAVLLDYFATWCGPCGRLRPELDAIAAERGDRLALVAVDVDQHGAFAQTQGVATIPDVRLWKDGKEIARFGGYRGRAEIAAWLDSSLAQP